MLIGFLIANLALTVGYFVVKRARGEGAGMALFFLFLPGLGFLIYFLTVLIQTFMEKVGVDREAVLTHAFEIERQPEHPDVREALNVVPVEDAMAVGANADKRALLLKQLKKDLQANYRILLVAEQDSDSESAHYVAAAKMEMYRLHQARWLECRRDYERDPDNAQVYHTACTVLSEMLASEVLSAREQRAYQRRLCELVQRQMATAEEEATAREYEECLACLVALGRQAEAERLWQRQGDRMRSETAYREMLKLYHDAGDRQKFEDILDDLRKNRQVRLSPDGLEQLRYWMGRLAS